MAQEIIKEKAAQIVDRFPWGFYITEEHRPQLTSMMEEYLEADTYDNAGEVLKKFKHALYDNVGNDTPLPVLNWLRYKVPFWVLTIGKAWLDIHGPRHTREEVMKIAADFWCEQIFDKHIQNIGCNSDVRDKAWYLIAEYYGKLFDESLPNMFHRGLRGGAICGVLCCDELYGILKDAGVKESDIFSIVPISAFLDIRDLDKSLVGESGIGNVIVL